MASISKFILETPNYGRSISDEAWETTDVEHIVTWSSAKTLLQRHEMKSEKGHFVILADWAPILRKHKHHFATMKRLHRNMDQGRADIFEKAKFPKRTSRNSLKVQAADGSTIGAAGAVESLCYDVFLIMNIAAPGCCDFYRAVLWDKQQAIDISLSNFYFEIAFLISHKNRWLNIRTLPLDQVTTWFRTVRNGASQVPQNPMERVLFALMHIAKLEMSPMVVIWLFYAFESLLQTRVGENFSSLLGRLTSLLGANEQEAKLMKKKLRSLYDIRNGIVHGGLEVSHPIHDESLDKRVDENYLRLSDAADFGYAILLASIQKTIEQGWSYPVFEEKLAGKLIETDRC